MSPFPCMKNTLSTVCLYVPSARSVLRFCMIRKRAAYACRTNLWITATISWRLFAFISYTETCCLRGSHTRAHVHFRWFQTRGHVRFRWFQTRAQCACMLPLVSDTRACVVRSPPNISSKTCHRTLWAALRSHRPCCQVAENSAKQIKRWC